MNIINLGKKVNVVKASRSPRVQRVFGLGLAPTGERRVYTHIQTEVSRFWEVVHNLGSTNILVEIYTEDGDDLDADYRILDENTLVVEVNPPMRGYVIVYG